MLCYHFSLEAVMQGMAENYPTGLTVISRVFVADLSMCLFAGKNTAQKLLLL